jgi:lysozyme
MKACFLLFLLSISAVEICMIQEQRESLPEPEQVVIPCTLELADDEVPSALPFQTDAHEKLVKLITDFEGFKPRVYLCPAGQRTIGYGFTGSRYIKRGKMTEREAKNILINEIIPETRAIVRKHVKVPLSPYQEAALISFCFNCGEDSLKALVCRKGRLNDWNFAAIPDIMKRYVKADGKTLKGLVKRRDQEAQLFTSEPRA